MAITDASGNIVQRYSYEAFGQLTASDPTFDNFYTYTGREYDKETGLYYYRARYYDAMEGRFISEDPISFLGGSTNLYSYVGNNAVNFIDPFGLEQIMMQVGTSTIAYEVTSPSQGSKGLSYVNKTWENGAQVGEEFGSSYAKGYGVVAGSIATGALAVEAGPLAVSYLSQQALNATVASETYLAIAASSSMGQTLAKSGLDFNKYSSYKMMMDYLQAILSTPGAPDINDWLRENGFRYGIGWPRSDNQCMKISYPNE